MREGEGAEKERLSLMEGKWRKQSMAWGRECGDLAPASGSKIGKLPLHQAFLFLPGTIGYDLQPHLSHAGHEGPDRGCRGGEG